MIDIVTHTKPVRKPRRPKLQLPLAGVVRHLRDFAAYTREPREIEEFAMLLQTMGADAATDYLLSQPPTCAWIDRLLSQMPEECRVIGTGINTVLLALRGKVVLS